MLRKPGAAPSRARSCRKQRLVQQSFILQQAWPAYDAAVYTFQKAGCKVGRFAQCQASPSSGVPVGVPYSLETVSCTASSSSHLERRTAIRPMVKGRETQSSVCRPQD